MSDETRSAAGRLTARRSFRRASADERRQALIQATLDCVAELGMHATTVREIAIRAGVTAGLIRHYFETKDHMIQEAYRVTMGEMTEMARAASRGRPAAPRARLRRFVAANLSAPMVDIKRLTLWAGFIGMIRTDEAMAAIHREAYVEFRDEIELLVGGVLEETGRPADIAARRRAAVKINAAIDGLWLEAALAPDLFESGDLVAMGIEAAGAVLGVALDGDAQE